MQIKIYDEQDDFEVDNICLSSYDIEDDEDIQRLMELIQDVIVSYLESQEAVSYTHLTLPTKRIV